MVLGVGVTVHILLAFKLLFTLGCLQSVSEFYKDLVLFDQLMNRISFSDIEAKEAILVERLTSLQE